MSLSSALVFHSNNDLVNAELHYKLAIKERDFRPVLFQNYGALLRAQGKIKESRSFYEYGLKLFPDSLSILSNRANLELKERPTVALRQYIYILARQLLANQDTKVIQTTFGNLLQCMSDLGLTYLPYLLFVKYRSLVPLNSALTLYLLKLIHSVELAEYLPPDSRGIKLLISEIDQEILNFELVDQAELHFSLASFFSEQLKHEAAFTQYNKGTSITNNYFTTLDPEDQDRLSKSINVHSWNFSNILIKTQNFSKGWLLYDYGLLTPADGAQRWQRALSKPFTSSELPLWKGEPLKGLSILLLEEQGVGDAMQFITLVPKLFNIAKHVGLLVSKRLFDLYNSSFSDDIRNGSVSLYLNSHAITGVLKSDLFDYQLPIGSLCQHLFTHPSDYHPRVPILKSNASISNAIRSNYLSRFPSASRIVGISWRGGGNASRIKMKSIDQNQFLNILKDHPDVIFVSLQYGESGSTIDAWNKLGHNINLIYDNRFNPLKDIKSWIDQVNACDAVISVANTTIHGSGGLNIPTHCLLSRHADWRWLSNPSVQRSFWYPSVGISRQNETTGSWHDAVFHTRSWMFDGCPMPIGIDHV